MRHIEIVTCECCGVKFEARAKNAKYCSHNCANQRYTERRKNKKKEDKEPRCPNNRWVVCEKQCGCESCGWNPEVAQRRLDKILGRECTA